MNKLIIATVLAITVGTGALGQSVDENAERLLQTYACPNSNLGGAELEGVCLTSSPTRQI